LWSRLPNASPVTASAEKANRVGFIIIFQSNHGMGSAILTIAKLRPNLSSTQVAPYACE
jgi:hypothetical protein